MKDFRGDPIGISVDLPFIWICTYDGTRNVTMFTKTLADSSCDSDSITTITVNAHATSFAASEALYVSIDNNFVCLDPTNGDVLRSASLPEHIAIGPIIKENASTICLFARDVVTQSNYMYRIPTSTLSTSSYTNMSHADWRPNRYIWTKLDGTTESAGIAAARSPKFDVYNKPLESFVKYGKTRKRFRGAYPVGFMYVYPCCSTSVPQTPTGR